jgi:putative acetyltransferase
MSPLSSAGSLVRLEQPGDATRIRQVNELAFEGAAEADLIEALRASGGITLSVVAILGGVEIDEPALEVSAFVANEKPRRGHVGPEVYGGEIAGHALVTPVTVSTDHGEVALLGLGPVAVLPAEQRRGIGSHLVKTCLEWLRAQGHAGIVAVGEPGYYQRLGFIPAGRWGLRWEVEVPNESFMALELSPGRLGGMAGVVRYRPEFAGA